MSDNCLKKDCHCQRYKIALERLVSGEAFTGSFYIQDNQEGRELRAKYQYTHGVLKEGQPGRCIGHSIGDPCFCFGERRNPEEGLGEFWHHPDPAIDFCVEVDAIEGMAVDCKLGLESRRDLNERIFKAMQFRVGGDERAVKAKGKLREIEAAHK